MSAEVEFFGEFRPCVPGAILPRGRGAALLQIQREGLTGNFTRSGYPFDTPMWDGGVGTIRSAPIIHNDDETPSPSQDAWWPYEQSAYLLGGVLKTAILTADAPAIGFFERNLFFLVRHPDAAGRLGTRYGCDIHWPMVPFFRAAAAYAEYSGNTEVEAAFIRHYQALSVEEIAAGFRHINNLEGLLTAYEWSGDRRLLEKAEAAYRYHNEFFGDRPEGIRELYFDKLKSMERHLLHGVTFSEGIKLPVLLYMYTGKKDYLDAAEYALRTVMGRHGTIAGLPSSNEFFSGRDPLQGYESCLINDFTWALGVFLRATGKAEYADGMEKIIFNALGGAVARDFTALMYLSSPNQVIAAPEANHAFFYRGSEDVMQFRPDHSAQCCPGNIHHALPNFIMMQFMYRRDGVPAAVLYGAAVWHGEYRGRNFTVTEDTAYPHGEEVLFTVECGETMPFSLRIPGWCDRAGLQVNGRDAGIRLSPGTFVTIPEVRDGDRIRLHLPMGPVERHERHWRWFEAGPLVFSLPVAYEEHFEYDSRFAPRSCYPVSPWNYSPLSGTARLVRGKEALRMVVSATGVTGFDALEQGRYTPQVPLYCRRCGETRQLTLVPYAEAKLRITAFPDGETRRPLFIYQALVSEEIFPYDEKLPLGAQGRAPENLSPEQPGSGMRELFPEKDGYYDLLRFFGKADHCLTYVTLRFWSDEDRRAVFSVGADTAAVFSVNGVECFELLPGSEAMFTAGRWFTAPVKRGFNRLLCKVAKGTLYEQYRNAWGVRADIFTVG